MQVLTGKNKNKHYDFEGNGDEIDYTDVKCRYSNEVLIEGDLEELNKVATLI